MNGCENMWILKPTCMSRGRGVKLYQGFSSIINKIKESKFTWVGQKYMENPMLYKGRKLDLRQWCLVIDVDPIQIWFFKECYVRLSTEAYDLKDFKNRFKHLTNNSVNKKAEGFVKEDGFLSQTDFKNHIDSAFGKDSFLKI